MVCDTQVVFFADGGTYYEVPNHTAVKRAVDTLSGLPFVGVVNHYSESMLILESIVHEWNPSFNAAYFPQNVSIGRHASLSRRLESIENEIGSSLYDHLFINNSYDIELFDAACSKLLKAVKSIDGWETKLHNLNSRCEMLR
jgi:hypothetical protein